MGQCLGKLQKDGAQNPAKDPFPDNCTESDICNYYVDRLPARLLGDGIHLLRGGPGPIMQGWTHELLNDAGVHSYQDRELLLKTRDEIVDAVEVHRQRLRQLHPSRSSSCGDCRSRASYSLLATESTCNNPSPAGSISADPPILRKSPTAGSATSAMEASKAGAGAPVDKAAARELAEKAAAATAAEATAKTTAFRSDGDGKSFRLTTDWLPGGPRLYRISEEIRHMASSGALETSVHSKSAGILDGPTAAKVAAAAATAAAAAAAAGAPLQTRSKSRFYSSGGGGNTDATAFARANGERDDDGSMQDCDADNQAVLTRAVSPPGADASYVEDSSPLGLLPLVIAGAGSQRAQRHKRGMASSIAMVEACGACSCDSASGSSGIGEDSVSAGSRSPGSTLGAESLAALTSLEAPPLLSPPPPSLVADKNVTMDPECAITAPKTAQLLPCPTGANPSSDCCDA